MARIKFTGGPYDGQTLSMFPQSKNAPDTMGCYTDAVKVGMYGIYRKTGNQSMEWHPVAPPGTSKAAAKLKEVKK